MRYRRTDSGGCPSDPVASRPAMQEPGTARGGDGESRHAGRGLYGVGAQRAADPRLHTSRAAHLLPRAAASVTTRSPVMRRPSAAHVATISYVPGCALGGTRNCPIASSSCALGRER